MRALDAKLWRDLRALAGPALAIALVVAGGVVSFIAMRGSYRSIEVARDAFYARARFADVFVHLVRAPRSLLPELAGLPGVEALEARLTLEVVLDVPGMAEPARARLTTLPDDGPPRLNTVVLKAGRWPEPGRLEEVLVGEAFALAHHLEPGAALGATLGGRHVALSVVGVAVSPEHVYVVPPDSGWPDDRRYGVLWTTERATAAAVGFVGAFNDLVLSVRPGADVEGLRAELDRRLARYGSWGAGDRQQQLSHRYLGEELQQLDTQTWAVPLLFLGVSALVLHLVLSRLVDSQRETTALLKALGYRDRELAWHFLELALVVVLAGAALGLVAGRWVGGQNVAMYRGFFRLDRLEFVLDRGSAALAVGLSLLAGLLGALSAVRRVLALQPAEAMQPPAPPAFSRGLLERLGLVARLGPRPRMVLRQLTRHPGRSALTVLGLAFALGTVEVATVLQDAVSSAIDRYFRDASREDVQLGLLAPRPRGELESELLHLPGVLRVESMRLVPLRLRNGHRAWEGALEARPAAGELRQDLDEHGRALPPLPSEGLVLTDALAARLGVVPGDLVTVERLDGDRRVVRAPVSGLTREGLGLHVAADLAAAQRLLGEPDVANGALLRVEPAAWRLVAARLKALPNVVGAAFRLEALAAFRRIMAEAFDFIRAMLLLFASLMAVGIVYNAGRIALAERSRELATLRVLGFSRGEVSGLFLGEQLLLVALSLAPGWALGWGLTWFIITSVSSGDLFRLTVVTPASSYVFATLVVVGAALATALLLRRRLDRLDLVAVLKARE